MRPSTRSRPRCSRATATCARPPSTPARTRSSSPSSPRRRSACRRRGDMNFEYSDEQRLLSDTLRKFLGTGYSFDARGKIIASPAGFSDDVWAALAEMGILSVPFDAVYGGFGGTTIDMLIVFEAFGEALVVEPYLATVGLGGRFVARGGSAEQRARILPALIQGKHKMAFAQTEVDARWDLRRVTTRATKSGDGWVLEGDKRAVLHGGSADTLVVSARTGGAPDDARGISLFLVERTAPGVAVTDYRGLDNRRVVSAAKIKIADAARHVSQEAVQLHGGMGMTEELKISHTFRRLTMIAQAFGDADHHLARFGAAS